MNINVKELQKAIALHTLGEWDKLEKRNEEINKFYEKADELYNTQTTNNGAEFVPTDVLNDNLIDLSPEVFDFVSYFNDGYQGDTLNKTETFPLIWEAGVMLSRSENKDASSFTANDITPGPNSDELVVKQGLFKKEIGITEVEATFSVVRLDTVIRRKLDQYFRNTLMNYILNADSDVTTANINDNGVAIASSTVEEAISAAIGGNDGLRKEAIGNGVVTLGTLDASDWTEMLKQIVTYAGDRGKIKIFMDQETALEAEEVLQDLLQYVDRSAIVDGYFGTYKGVEHISTKWLKKVTATGVVDGVTPANNTKGQFLVVYTPAVVHGFGKRVRNIWTEMSIDGDTSISLTTNFGCAIANKKAGLAEVVALGVVDL